MPSNSKTGFWNGLTGQYIILSALLIPFFLFIMPVQGHEFDKSCWIDWAKYINQNGLGDIYNSSTDYPPLYHYILWVYVKIQGTDTAIANNIHHLKFFTLAFHFGTSFVLLQMIRSYRTTNQIALIHVLFYLLNAAVLYNLMYWGQVDDIQVFLVFTSIYLAWKQKVNGSLILLVLAINFKLQALVFIPLVGLILLPEMIRNFSWTRLFKWIGIPLLVQTIIILPFMLNGSLGELSAVITGSFVKYPMVSLNAFNFWELIMSGDLTQVPDTRTWMFLTYKQWGLIIFFGMSFVALLPLLKRTYKAILRKRSAQVDIGTILLTGGLIALIFFYVNTEMHERYSHVALIYIIGYCIIYKKPLPGILISIAYSTNLEFVLNNLKWGKHIILDPNLIAWEYLVVIVWGYWELFRKEIKVHREKRDMRIDMIPDVRDESA